uniref:Uncharacterized protein n=1 Tax=Caenorhabditis japonica TaxID=281687 RepID=A0A8R1IZ96_CAEJA
MKNETATSGQTNDQRKLFERILIINSQLISYGETIDTFMVKEEIVGKFRTDSDRSFQKENGQQSTMDPRKILDDIETFIYREEEMNLLMKKDQDKQSKSKRDNLKSDKQKFNKHFKSDKDEVCIFCQQIGNFSVVFETSRTQKLKFPSFIDFVECHQEGHHQLLNVFYNEKTMVENCSLNCGSNKSYFLVEGEWILLFGSSSKLRMSMPHSSKLSTTALYDSLTESLMQQLDRLRGLGWEFFS